VRDQFLRRRGNHDLAAMRRGSNAGSTMNVHAHIVRLAQDAFASVDTNPNLYWQSPRPGMCRKPLLNSDRRAHSLSGGPKGNEERISLCVTLGAARRRDGTANDLAVLL
jgi:hypothetical protein